MVDRTDKYELLREAARRKRDVLIREVRADYQRELLAIKRLRDSLEESPRGKRGPKSKLGPRQRSMIELVREYMPRDRQFTVAEIRDKLAEVEPFRRFYRATLRTTFANLKREGSIKRVRRIGKGQVLWEAVETAPRYTPFEALLMPDAAYAVLAENGPMRCVEIAVALQERGYRRDANPRTLCNSLLATLKRNVGRFRCGEDGKWATSGPH
jgi:hypothetical protein